MSTTHNVTELLTQWANGDEQALQDLRVGHFIRDEPRDG